MNNKWCGRFHNTWCTFGHHRRWKPVLPRCLWCRYETVLLSFYLLHIFCWQKSLTCYPSCLHTTDSLPYVYLNRGTNGTEDGKSWTTRYYVLLFRFCFVSPERPNLPVSSLNPSDFVKFHRPVSEVFFVDESFSQVVHTFINGRSCFGLWKIFFCYFWFTCCPFVVVTGVKFKK